MRIAIALEKLPQSRPTVLVVAPGPSLDWMNTDLLRIQHPASKHEVQMQQRLRTLL